MFMLQTAAKDFLARTHLNVERTRLSLNAAMRRKTTRRIADVYA
jgi:hypothetical protein